MYFVMSDLRAKYLANVADYTDREAALKVHYVRYYEMQDMLGPFTVF